MTATNRDIILLVDDDPQVLKSLIGLFEDDYEVLSANSGDVAIQMANEHPHIAAVVMDIKMPGTDGITTARTISRIRPDLAIIFHTGYPGEYHESQIMSEEKPYDYVEKGLSSHRLIRSVQHAVENFRLRSDAERLRELAQDSFGIVGKSTKMIEVFRLIQKVGPFNNKVMILGETGTGKELVARALHCISPRSKQKLVIFNCNHKSADLVESEIFGHTRGAFTGAIADRIGLFEYANGGTVFLDEIGDLDITTQAKLLRVLETGEFQQVGSPKAQKCDVRLICATHRDLEAMVKESKFREDLYYRLRGIEIRLPALRDRREDIPILVEAFVDRFTIERDLPPYLIDHDALELLINFDWPGNVRQLLDTIESLVLLADSHLINKQDVERQLRLKPRAETSYGNNRTPLAQRLRDYRRTCIIEALSQANNNLSEAARILGVDRSNLRKDIKDLDIPLG